MQADRIAELLAPFLGTPPANHALYRHISTYINILLRWNARINLTAIRDPEDIVIRHFGESLFAARHLFPDPVPDGKTDDGKTDDGQTEKTSSASSVSSAVKDVDFAVDSANDQQPFLPCPKRSEGTSHRPTVADLGSGAGFPGLPIKLWAPQIALTLIESNHKKATFLREVTRALTLTDVNIQNIRARTPPAETPNPSHLFDVVTLRAVEHFPQALPVAASLVAPASSVAPAGRLLLLIGASQLDQVLVTLPTFSWHSPINVPLSNSRVMLLGDQLTAISKS